MFDDLTLRDILLVISPVVAVALSYGALRAQVKTIDADLKKLTADQEAQKKQITDLDKNKASRELEKNVATLETQHNELSKRHNEGMTEARTRLATVESRVTLVEQTNVELRAQINSVVQGVSRVEAKQDRAAEQISELRRDLMEFMLRRPDGRQ